MIHYQMKLGRAAEVKIEMIGCDGGPGPGRYPMTLLVEDSLLLDAGSALSGMDPARLPAVRAVLLSHGHLDHVRELGFIPFHRDPERDGLLQVCAVPGVLDAVRAAVFNGAFWIDFEKPEPPRRRGIEYRALRWERPVDLAGIEVEAVRLTHSRYETSGFILDGGGASVVYALDSGPTRRIWEREEEILKLGPHRPRIFATHLKPEFRSEIEAEIKRLPFPVELPGRGDVLEL